MSSNSDAYLPTGFSLHHTEPVQQGHYSIQSWNQSGQGQQYFQPDTVSQGHSHNGFSQSFQVGQMSQNQSNGRASQGYPDNTREQWNEDSAATQSVAMARFDSQDSMGAQSQRTAASSISDYHDHARSVRMYPSITQVSFPMSSAPSDVRGRSASPADGSLFTPTQTEYQVYDNFQFNAEDITDANTFFHRDSVASIANRSVAGSVTTDASASMFATADDMPYGPQERPSRSLTGQISIPTSGPMAYQSNGIMESPHLWQSNTLDSQTSSPIMFTEHWALSQQMPPTTNPNNYSPSIPSTAALSPQFESVELPETLLPYPSMPERPMRKPVGPRLSKVASDLTNRGRLASTSTNKDEPFKLATRANVEIDNSARDHPLYHNVTAHSDGLYHCPWEGQSTCQHKPEKLKCNYDKFVDSHLKPYRCKVLACENLSFSSTACLLRHEREAHAMHGHGDKPYLCKYDGCDRGVPGNGFPRSWNLKDHMKRVHNDPGLSPRNNASGSPTPSVRSTKRRKAEAKEPEKESVQAVQQGPSDKDRYFQSEERLMETVKRLKALGPEKVSTMLLLRDARNYINQMAETTQRIHAPSGLKRSYSQQSG
ncbi:C2H2 transcription factor [Phlyctema vagabunda]|uniref:C2H2 transcription factor n=1 Tax=Phlyctema vagabunda TaxID=108571 RepID=A0ABR4PY12_9HELO